VNKELEELVDAFAKGVGAARAGGSVQSSSIAESPKMDRRICS
jgi:hypothetical protein